MSLRSVYALRYGDANANSDEYRQYIHSTCIYVPALSRVLVYNRPLARRAQPEERVIDVDRHVCDRDGILKGYEKFYEYDSQIDCLRVVVNSIRTFFKCAFLLYEFFSHFLVYISFIRSIY